MCFLNLIIAYGVSDSTTICNFKTQLIDLYLVEKLVELFLVELEQLNLILNEDKIINASFIKVPK